ncbi:hypothetical protein [Metaclostridioides mangenotii]|uniref:hypothetical protein n=1 Tax=Metaclostridioides mangenotii TaxID=1540 RepID=UPI0004A3CFFD|nr:hypothetical protein [Clostridioides mangenotii]
MAGMEGIVIQFANLGIVSLIAYVLVNNVLYEKKEDRTLYKQSVDTFTKKINHFADNIYGLCLRIEGLEESNKRIEKKKSWKSLESLKKSKVKKTLKIKKRMKNDENLYISRP